MNKPLISVIIPAHNGELYLADAIRSVLNQTYPHVELWVIDNGSKDKTAEISRLFPEVHYIYLEVADTATARNEGILRSCGSLLAFLDQDDVWTPDKLEKQWAYLQKTPEINAVVCLQQMILEKGHAKPHWLKKEFLERAEAAYLPSALLIKKTVLKQTHFFDPKFSLTSDVAWFFKAKHQGIEVALLPEVLLIRRIHSDNASNRYAQIQKELLSVVRVSLQERRTKISVIITVWNGENYLREAVESVLAQDYSNKEIIAVDDGSTDKTRQILESFGDSIRVIYQPNQGLGAARNTGIRAATGAYLSFLDHDDIWERSKLSLQMARMDKTDPLVFSYVRQFICPSLSREESKRLHVNEENIPANFAGNLLLSKKRFLQVGPFFEKKTVGEFVDWYARAIEAKIPIVMLPETTLYRRVHSHNMGRRKDSYDRSEYLKILKNSLDRRRSCETAP